MKRTGQLLLIAGFFLGAWILLNNVVKASALTSMMVAAVVLIRGNL